MTRNSFTAGTHQGRIAGWESGVGLPVLFLHGGPGINEYGELLSAEAAGYRFLSFQQRGVSPSTGSGPFTMEQHTADAAAVLDNREVMRAVIVGHSFGGYLALHFAVSHPERVAGLVLIDGLGVVGDGGLAELGQELTARLLPDARDRMRQLGEEMGDHPTDELASEQQRLLWPGYFADPASAPAFDLRVSVAAHLGARASIAAHQSSGFTDALAGLTIPVVSVLGERSPLPVSQGKQTAALIPGADVRVIPGAGHLPWHEEPGCVAAALANVWARAAGEAGSLTA